MSTREMALNIISGMSEQQLLEIIRDQIGLDDIPNAETLEALAELKYMKAHPEEYKSYISVDAMFDEILGEDDDD
ncbi:MAG: hypothetical protein IKH71_08630 [Oscillospiraceae bacterium]|nr:hypothetical protein [Oscillospiraceae bacterium]